MCHNHCRKRAAKHACMHVTKAIQHLMPGALREKERKKKGEEDAAGTAEEEDGSAEDAAEDEDDSKEVCHSCCPAASSYICRSGPWTFCFHETMHHASF